MIFQVKVLDNAGKILSQVAGEPENLAELIDRATHIVTRSILERNMESLPEEMQQPLRVEWGKFEC